jgi:hypothetical protein
MRCAVLHLTHKSHVNDCVHFFTGVNSCACFPAQFINEENGSGTESITLPVKCIFLFLSSNCIRTRRFVDYLSFVSSATERDFSLCFIGQFVRCFRSVFHRAICAVLRIRVSSGNLCGASDPCFIGQFVQCFRSVFHRAICAVLQIRVSSGNLCGASDPSCSYANILVTRAQLLRTG